MTQRRNVRKGKTVANAEQTAFLEQYAIYGIITTACELSGIDRTKVYRWKERDPAFAERMAEAEKKANDLLLQEARRRAVEGVPRYVVQKAEIVRLNGQPLIQNEYSDRLLELLLRGRLPDMFKDRTEHSTPNGDGLNIIVSSKSFKVAGSGEGDA